MRMSGISESVSRLSFPRLSFPRLSVSCQSVAFAALLTMAAIAAQPAHAEQPGGNSKKATGLPVVQVWKSPTCGCCSKWIDHMKEAGFTVKARDMDDITMVKRLAGVPDNMASCHTAVVNGYVIEGHVPAKDVKRLLKERPQNITGLSVPGMVSGSPGMENGRVEPYDVVSFGNNGVQVFSSYR